MLSRLIGMGRGDGLRAQLLRGGISVGVLRVLSLPLTLASSILLARGLGSQGYGEYAFVIALISTLSIPLAPAMLQLITREAAAFRQAGEGGRIRALLQWGHRHVLFGSVAIGILLGGIAFWFADWRVDDRWTLVFVGLLALPLLGLNAVRAGVLAGLCQVARAQIPDLLVRPMVLLIVAGTLLMAGSLNPLSAVAAFVSGTAMAFIVAVVLLQRTLPNIVSPTSCRDDVQKRKWVSAWGPFTLLVTASALNAQIGILLLGWLCTADQVAAMQVAERGAILVVLSLSVVNLVIGPHITQVYRSGDLARLQALSRHSARMALIVAFPIALPLIFLGSPILRIVFGPEYVEIATLPLAILAVSQLINVGFGSVGMLLTMSGFERDTLLGQVIALVVNMVAAVILIPQLGATGAALATAIGLVIWNVVLAVLVARRMSMRPGAI